MSGTRSREWVETWLSKPRFASYLRAAGQDRQRAVALYEWNARAASVFHHDLGHFEVGLRNAYDRALCAAAPDDSPHWVFDPDRFFPPQRRKANNGTNVDMNRTQRKNIEAALGNASPADGSAPAAGKVIAELSFGFWRYLTTKGRERSLWLPHLRNAFRPGTTRRDVDKRVSPLHNLRNRVAHHEPLFRAPLDRHFELMIEAAELFSSELAAYIRDTSSWPGLRHARPEVCDDR